MSIDETKAFIPLGIAVLTVSDTRTLADDKSGTTLADRIVAAGHTLAAREIIVDDVDAIRVIVKRWIANPDVDAIITTGGTGFTGRDVTPEAIEPLFEKRMDGFSIAFHMLSHAKIGTSTIQSRATAGVAGATYIFCLPGSPGACRDGWDGILAPQLDYRTRPCNFVEIMPEGAGRVDLASVIPGRCEASNYGAQWRTGESRDSGFASRPGMTRENPTASSPRSRRPDRRRNYGAPPPPRGEIRHADRSRVRRRGCSGSTM